LLVLCFQLNKNLFKIYVSSLTGYTGNRFYTYPQFGHTSKVESTSALCDYTNNYQFTKSSEFTPLPFYHASLHGDRPGNEIYPRTKGLIPSYKGHVPGMQHRWGGAFEFFQTFHYVFKWN
jgi:hypothetical protein